MVKKETALKRMLTSAKKNPRRITYDEKFWNREFLDHFMDWCGAESTFRPGLAVHRASLAFRAARALGDKHSKCRALALLGTAHRLQGNHQEAEKLFAHAENGENRCICCLGDIYRRRGCLRLSQNETNSAIDCFNKGIVLCKANLDWDGVGRILITRGQANNQAGNLKQAVADERDALKLLSIDTPQVFHLAAVTNMGCALVYGADEHFLEAATAFSSFENKLQGVSGFTEIRQNLRWLDGLVLARLNHRRRALPKLRTVRKSLIGAQLVDDAVAITADISALYGETKRYQNIVDMTTECLSELRVGGDTRKNLEDLLLFARRETSRVFQYIVKIRSGLDVPIPFIFEPICPPIYLTPH